jgi:hypothetical protein
MIPALIKFEDTKFFFLKFYYRVLAETYESCPHPHFLFEIHFNIILPSTPRSPTWSSFLHVTEYRNTRQKEIFERLRVEPLLHSEDACDHSKCE